MARTGRPPYRPTERDRQTVELMIAAGIEQDNIALCLGITRPTLAKHFKHELKTAAHRANAQVAGSLFKKAVSPDHPGAVTAAIWWTKTRMSWREKTEQAITGPDGGPIKVEDVTARELLARKLASLTVEKPSGTETT